jgi:hypothetical protein
VKDPLPVGPVDPEGDRLVTELNELGPYDGWRFSYEYPGYFCYSHPDLPYNVFFTPDWSGVETLPIEVQDDEGRHCEEHSATLPLPREGRTGRQLLDLVRPTLDKLAKLPRRHLAYVEADFESMRRGGSCRTAACLCGWRGPERATLDLAADDALTHERFSAHS